MDILSSNLCVTRVLFCALFVSGIGNVEKEDKTSHLKCKEKVIEENTEFCPLSYQYLIYRIFDIGFTDHLQTLAPPFPSSFSTSKLPSTPSV